LASQTPDKTSLRRQMRARRGAFDSSAGERAAEQLPSKLMAGHGVVGGYQPRGGEIDPGPLLRRFAAAGASLALPVAISRDAPLIYRAWARGDPLEPDVFGIPAPTSSAPAVTPGLIIVPVVAFDRGGHRLGQGGGSFDRTIEALRAAGEVLVIGLAFAGQEAQTAPHEAHDQPLDAILTESGYIEVRKDF
jgi:5-formyltetrahydrofolate cyclo-ligase